MEKQQQREEGSNSKVLAPIGLGVIMAAWSEDLSKKELGDKFDLRGEKWRDSTPHGPWAKVQFVY